MAPADDAAVDASTPLDSSPATSAPPDATSPPRDAANDVAVVDSGSDVADAGPLLADAGPSPGDAGSPDAPDPAADCLLAGTPPDGGDPSSNPYMQSCGGDPAGMTTAQNGSPCTIGVLGQHCFLQCAFCKNGSPTSPPSSLLLPCTQPINNCCGVLTCGGCGTCS